MGTMFDIVLFFFFEILEPCAHKGMGVQVREPFLRE